MRPLALLLIFLPTVALSDEAGVKRLTKELSSSNPIVRAKAAKQLGELGDKATGAVDALVNSLKDKVPAVRAAAARALGELGPSAKKAVPALSELILDRDIEVRRAVLRTVRSFELPSNVVLPIFVKTLESADPADVVPAMQTLAELGEKAVPRLIDALKDKQACYWACLVVAEIGDDAKATIPHLRNVLQHKHPECRMVAIEALGKVGPAASACAEDIADLVENDPIGGVRYQGLLALGSIGSRDGLPAVRNAMSSDDPFMQVVAAWALLKLDAKNEKSVEQGVKLILNGVNSKNAAVRDAAIEAISDIDAPPDTVGPVVLAALKSGDETFVANVIDAIASLGPKVIDRVIKGLQKDENEYALRIVVRMGPVAKKAVPTLVQLLKGSDSEKRREVHFALGAIGPDAAPAVPNLIQALNDDDFEVRYSACYALGKIGPKAKLAIPVLMKNLKSQDEVLRVASIWAMLKIQSDPGPLRKIAVPLLIGALKSEQELVRVEVAQTLGDLGSDARVALDALRKIAAEDKSLLVRATAKQAIEKIE